MNEQYASLSRSRTCYSDIVNKNNHKGELTGISIKTPIGTTEAMSVKVLLSAFFSFSVNSSPIMVLLTKPVAAPTSIARS